MAKFHYLFQSGRTVGIYVRRDSDGLYFDETDGSWNAAPYENAMPWVADMEFYEFDDGRVTEDVTVAVRYNNRTVATGVAIGVVSVLVQGFGPNKIDTLVNRMQEVGVYRGDVAVSIPYNLQRDISGYTMKFAAKASYGDTSFVIGELNVSGQVTDPANGIGTIPLGAGDLDISAGDYIAELRGTVGAAHPFSEEVTFAQFTLKVIEDVMTDTET